MDEDLFILRITSVDSSAINLFDGADHYYIRRSGTVSTNTGVISRHIYDVVSDKNHASFFTQTEYKKYFMGSGAEKATTTKKIKCGIIDSVREMSLI